MRISFMLAALNSLDDKMADIDNACLTDTKKASNGKNPGSTHHSSDN
jgi:hypothetical protein